MAVIYSSLGQKDQSIERTTCISNSLIISNKGVYILLIIRWSNLRGNVKADSRLIWNHNTLERIDHWRIRGHFPRCISSNMLVRLGLCWNQCKIWEYNFFSLFSFFFQLEDSIDLEQRFPEIMWNRTALETQNETHKYWSRQHSVQANNRWKCMN